MYVALIQLCFSCFIIKEHSPLIDYSHFPVSTRSGGCLHSAPTLHVASEVYCQVRQHLPLRQRLRVRVRVRVRIRIRVRIRTPRIPNPAKGIE